MHQNLLAYVSCCSTHFDLEIIREFVMSLQVIIYAKQNGAQMATFAATGTRADIDDLRNKEDNGGPGNEVVNKLLFLW